MKRVLLTGTTGFLGKSLAERLQGMKNYSTCQLLRHPNNALSDESDKFSVYRYDGSYTSVIDAFESFQPDIVVHLASMVLSSHSGDQIQQIIDSNITFGTFILESMAQQGCRRLVNTGTSWQHYRDFDYSPVNLYASTKKAFEDLAVYFNEAHGISVFNLHLFDTYGPNDNRNKLLVHLKDVFERSLSLEMTCGDQEINLTYIDDIVDAYIVAIESISQYKSAYETYAIRHPETIRLKDLVSLIEDITGKIIDIEWCSRPYRPREMMKTWKTGKILDSWTPKYSLREGLVSYFK